MDNSHEEIIQFARSLGVSQHIATLSDLKKLPSLKKARIQAWIRKQQLDVDIFGDHSDTVSKAALGSEVSRGSKNSRGSKLISIGVDIQHLGEFSTDETDPRQFLRDFGLYTEAEISYCLASKLWNETAAGIFSAKEAVYKASSSKQFSGVDEIEIIHENGIPKSKGFALSISHDSEYAIAMAVCNNSSFEKESVDDSRNNSDAAIETIRHSFNKKLWLAIVGLQILGSVAVLLLLKLV